MLGITNKVKVIEGMDCYSLSEEIIYSPVPLLLKGCCNNWPIVEAGKKSVTDGADYIRSVYSGEPVSACYGEPEIDGRIFFNNDLSGFNY